MAIFSNFSLASPALIRSTERFEKSAEKCSKLVKELLQKGGLVSDRLVVRLLQPYKGQLAALASVVPLYR
ncbi:hypothetical protein TYRP_022754 [Tyrophagus putrescentiae]|nr:hypothetical protein TYRP_022754 [Tyrophagus putrescentiae]